MLSSGFHTGRNRLLIESFFWVSLMWPVVQDEGMGEMVCLVFIISEKLVSHFWANINDLYCYLGFKHRNFYLSFFSWKILVLFGVIFTLEVWSQFGDCFLVWENLEGTGNSFNWELYRLKIIILLIAIFCLLWILCNFERIIVTCNLFSQMHIKGHLSGEAVTYWKMKS